MGSIFLLTGESGAGKTRFCRRLVDAAAWKGLSVAGLLSPSVFWEGSKVGILAQDAASGERRPLARRARTRFYPSLDFEISLGDWLFAASTLSWANALFARIDAPQWLLVDELGPLEFIRGGGLQQAMTCLDKGRYDMALCVVRPSLLKSALRRWPLARVLHPADGIETLF